MNSKIEAGDLVKGATARILMDEPREVLAVADGWAMLSPADGLRSPYCERVEQLVKVERFFEVGKTYKQYTDWSIAAQAGPVTERFEVARVERNGNGVLVAFGRLTTTDGKRGPVDVWVLREAWAYANGNWEEA